MIRIRKREDRGHTDRGWVRSYHTFSFGSYQDAAHNGFRALKVLNDDRIAAGRGFGPHAHRDMEIVTYVLEGRLAHRDSMGERHTLGPNEVQAMSAGHGVVHSEFNASESDGVHSIQIWIEPVAEDLAPRYQQLAFDPAEKRGRLHLLAAPAAVNGDRVAVLNQDARVHVADLPQGGTVRHALPAGRYAWVQVVRGDVVLNGQPLREGDGAAVSDETELTLAGDGPEGGEFLLFDLT